MKRRPWIQCLHGRFSPSHASDQNLLASDDAPASGLPLRRADKVDLRLGMRRQTRPHPTDDVRLLVTQIAYMITQYAK